MAIGDSDEVIVTFTPNVTYNTFNKEAQYSDEPVLDVNGIWEWTKDGNLKIGSYDYYFTKNDEWVCDITSLKYEELVVTKLTESELITFSEYYDEETGELVKGETKFTR
jgi:hypothetical protein